MIEVYDGKKRGKQTIYSGDEEVINGRLIHYTYLFVFFAFTLKASSAKLIKNTFQKMVVVSMETKRSSLIKQLFTKEYLTETKQYDFSAETIMNYYRSLVNIHPNVLIVFSPTKEIITLNHKRVFEVLGIQPRHMNDFRLFFSAETFRLIEKSFDYTLKGRPGKQQVELLDQYGKIRFLSITFVPISAKLKQIEGVYVVIEDVTSQVDRTTEKQVEEKLKEMVERTQYIFNHLSSGFWVRDSIDGDFTYASKGLEKIFNISLDQFYTNKNIWMNHIHPQDREETSKSMETVSKGEHVQVIYRIISGDGSLKWVLEQIVPRENNDGKISYIFGMVTDITNEVESEEKLKYLTNCDVLTGLPNQHFLNNKLEKLIKQDSTFALLYIDLDGLKGINESLGYEIGDEALKIVAKRLQRSIPNNGFLARVNGNGFIIIVKYATQRDIFELAEKTIQLINHPLMIDNYVMHLSTYIGVTFFPEDGTNRELLIGNAKTALYHAKKIGNSNYQLFSYMKDISSFKQYMMEKDMQKALMDEEFTIYFQPQVEPVRGKLCGAEALLRWNHKDWGVISPSEFIPLAEENHLIHELTDWMIRKVCSTLQEWKLKEFRLQPISINISPIHFLKLGLVEFVKEQLETYDIPPQYLQFELTESSLLKSENYILTTINQLKMLGITIIINHFGTGQSSLDTLRKVKPDKIKLDDAFLLNDENNRVVNKGIVSSIIYLGKRLKIKVIAEGVTKAEQLSYLKQNDCDIVQGTIFSQPVPKELFEKYLKVGFLPLIKRNRKIQVKQEYRKFYRFELPFPIKGEMTIISIKGKEVAVGSSPILIENISLGGIKIVSNLKLPVNSNMKFKFTFHILNKQIEAVGILRWKEELEKKDMYAYGVQFNVSRYLEDMLAPIINRMTTLKKKNEKIPDTDFIYEEASHFLRKS